MRIGVYETVELPSSIDSGGFAAERCARAGESTDSGGHWAPSSKCGQCVMSTAKGRGLTDTCFCFGTATTTSEKFNTTTIARTVPRSMHQAFFADMVTAAAKRTHGGQHLEEAFQSCRTLLT